MKSWDLPKCRTKFYRICAWCKDVLGEVKGYTMDTHGICPKCAGVQLERVEKEKNGDHETDKSDQSRIAQTIR